MSVNQTNGIFATAGSVFAAVTVAANTVTTALNSANDMANALTLHSAKYLHETKIKLAAEAIQSEEVIIEEATHRMAAKLNEIKNQLNADPQLSGIYDVMRPKVQAAVDAALGRTSP